MPAETPLTRTRVYARLTNGEILVPGADPQVTGVRTCSGPDHVGLCPVARVGGEPICRGAEWLYDGSEARAWRFVFRPDTQVCPVSVLDPLGPMPTPQD